MRHCTRCRLPVDTSSSGLAKSGTQSTVGAAADSTTAPVRPLVSSKNAVVLSSHQPCVMGCHLHLRRTHQHAHG